MHAYTKKTRNAVFENQRLVTKSLSRVRFEGEEGIEADVSRCESCSLSAGEVFWGMLSAFRGVRAGAGLALWGVGIILA